VHDHAELEELLRRVDLDTSHTISLGEFMAALAPVAGQRRPGTQPPRLANGTRSCVAASRAAVDSAAPGAAQSGKVGGESASARDVNPAAAFAQLRQLIAGGPDGAPRPSSVTAAESWRRRAGSITSSSAAVAERGTCSEFVASGSASISGSASGSAANHASSVADDDGWRSSFSASACSAGEGGIAASLPLESGRREAKHPAPARGSRPGFARRSGVADMHVRSPASARHSQTRARRGVPHHSPAEAPVGVSLVTTLSAARRRFIMDTMLGLRQQLASQLRDLAEQAASPETRSNPQLAERLRVRRAQLEAREQRRMVHQRALLVIVEREVQLAEAAASTCAEVAATHVGGEDGGGDAAAHSALPAHCDQIDEPESYGAQRLRVLAAMARELRPLDHTVHA
jgi:hypothetical protein